MNKDMTSIWIFVVGQFIAILGVVIKNHISITNRLTAIEVYINLTGKKFAKLLHSPDNHHGMDALIDKYLLNDDLPLEDWFKWKELTERVIDNPKTDIERIIALQLHGMAIHKIACRIPKKELKGIIKLQSQSQLPTMYH